MVREEYGLIGYPLGHSFSADYFNDKFKAEKINASYRLFPLKNINDLPDLINRNPDLAGLNVTIPYKQTVMSILDSVSEDAAAIGAVNVLKISYDAPERRVLKGYNSDWRGFMVSLVPTVTAKMDKALILGTGGAAKAVGYALRKMKIMPTFVSRHAPETGRTDVITYSELTDSIVGSHLLVVNATPVGMWPKVDEAPPFPYEYLTSEHLCYDLIYNPEQTEFMKRAENYGARTMNGLQMLHNQAEEAWRIWQNGD